MDGVVGGRKNPLEEYADMQERLIRRLKETLEKLKRDETLAARSKLLIGTQPQPIVPWNPRSQTSSIAVIEDALMFISNKMRILPYPWRTYGDSPKDVNSNGIGAKGSSVESLVAQMSSSKPRVISVSSLASYASSTFDLKNPQRSDTLLRLPATIKPSIKGIEPAPRTKDSTPKFDPGKKMEIENWAKKIKSQLSHHGGRMSGIPKVTKHTSIQQTKVKSNLTQALNRQKSKEATKKDSHVTKPLAKYHSQNAPQNAKNLNSVVFPLPEETKKKHKDPFPPWWQRDLPNGYGILKKIQNDAKKMCSLRRDVSLPKVAVGRVQVQAQSAPDKEPLNSDQLLNLINGIYKAHGMVSQDEAESADDFGVKSKDRAKLSNFLRDLSIVLEKFVNGKDYDSDLSADHRPNHRLKKALRKKKHRPQADHGDRDETFSVQSLRIARKPRSKDKSDVESGSWNNSTRLGDPSAGPSNKFRCNPETNGEATPKTSRRPTPKKPPYQNLPPPLKPQRNFQMVEVSKIDIELSESERVKDSKRKKKHTKHGSRFFQESKSWESSDLKQITQPKKLPPPPSTSKEDF